MLPHAAILLVRIADPGTIDGLDAVVAAAAKPRVQWVRRERLPDADLLQANDEDPAVAPPLAPNLDGIAHPEGCP